MVLPGKAELIDGYRGIAGKLVKDQASGFLIESSVLKIEIRPAVAKTGKLVQGAHGLLLGRGKREQAKAEALG
jgi:hypothetical protein